MAAIINTNIQSLNAQRNLSTSQSSLATSMQRLSSGLRINSAKDDAAGLAISERMTTQIRGLNQAARNANDGISLAQTAEGALGSVGNNLQRIRELAVQSRNATNSTDDRAALQKEVAQLTSEIDRVARDTSFNGTNLLDGSFTAKAFQVGANQGQLINIDKIANASASALGTWDTVATASKMSVAAITAVPSQAAAAATVVGANTTQDVTFNLSTAQLTSSGAGGAVNYGYDAFKLNINGVQLDIDGSDATHADAATANTAMAAAVVAAFNAMTGPEKPVGVTATNSFGAVTFTAPLASTNPNGISVTGNGTGSGILAGVAVQAAPVISTDAVAAGKYFSALQPGDLQINGISIVVSGGAESAAGQQNKLMEAINAKSSETGVSAAMKDGKMVLKGATNDITITGTAAKLIENGLATGDTTAGTATKFVDSQKGVVGFKGVDISTEEGADNAIKAMDAALKAVNSARADLGAIQNRFTTTVENLQINSENLSASRSRIMDADFAQETANLSRSQILQQAGTAMVAQANQELFGSCTNIGECEAVCPKGIPLEVIAQMNRDYLKSAWTGRGESAAESA